MKMTLHIDERLLDRVSGLYGCESKTAAVDLALRELDRRHRLREFATTGLGLTATELRESVDPSYDVSTLRASPVPKPAISKPHGRRRTG